ncbi:MlaD family protein [Halomonas piscis]|uniref:MlaD family protein n=1 Tax=Halomonas piscis TaxID=3031727 RepID=A0ABY9Z1W8_9GAMM|nr:MlaD family protein [Halomonas piscis]WNK21144.1 MlaD family protein [Halomonas piscis]
MEPRAHHVLIGLFTIITLGGALLFALWLGKTSVERDYAYYEVGFNRAVSGLSEGNKVQYSGIEVGNVVRLSLDPEDPRHVRALIRVYSDIPVKQDTSASLALANITGSMNIQLLGGTPQSPRLQGNRNNPPMIEAKPSPLNSLLSNSEELFAQVDTLLEKANRLLSEENAEHLTRILGNVEIASQTLVDERGAIDQALTQFSRASVQAEKSLASFTRLSESAQGLLDEQGRPTLQAARQAMRDLAATTARLSTLTATHEGSLSQGLQGVGDLAPAMHELRSTLGQLNRITRRLEESPADFLLGRDPIQEFTP